MPIFLDGKMCVLFSCNDSLQENFQQPVGADGEGPAWPGLAWPAGVTLPVWPALGLHTML